MRYDTLVIAKGPTLADGLTDILRQADALAEGDALGCGVSVWRDRASGQLLNADPDPELPAGVIGTSAFSAQRTYPSRALPEVELLQPELRELLDHYTDRDLVVTAGAVVWL